MENHYFKCLRYNYERLAHKSTNKKKYIIAIKSIAFCFSYVVSFCKCKMWNVSCTTHTSLYFNRSLNMCGWLLFLLLFYFSSALTHCTSTHSHTVSMLLLFSFFIHSSHLLSISSHFFFSFLTSHLFFFYLSFSYFVCCWFLPRCVYVKQKQKKQEELMVMMKLCVFGTICVRTMCSVYYNTVFICIFNIFAVVSTSTIATAERQTFAACYNISEC